jgi:hypothetical protein
MLAFPFYTMSWDRMRPLCTHQTSFPDFRTVSQNKLLFFIPPCLRYSAIATENITVELLDHMVILLSSFKELPNCFPWKLYYLTLAPRVHKGSNLPTSSLTLAIFSADSSHPDECEVASLCGFSLEFPNDHKVKYLFMCVMIICISLYLYGLFKVLCSFLNRVIWFMCWVKKLSIYSAY